MWKAIGAGIILFIATIFGAHNHATTATTSPINVPTQKTVKQNVAQKQIMATSTKPIAAATQTKIAKTPPGAAGKIVMPTITVIQTPPAPQIPFTTLNTLARQAVVNILCTTQAGGPFSPISGSGVVVSSDGVILTNAHVGQFFLLRNFNGVANAVQCVIRAGSPAYPAYNAELIYISPTWVADNKNVLIETAPKGTGEHDYAFLLITDKVDGSPLLDPIPFLPIGLAENYFAGQYVLLDSYAAGFLGGQSILQDLYQTSAIATTSQIYTFGSSTADLISLPGTVVSQSGSSGGAVVDGDGNLVGLISTETEGDTTGDRSLQAITTTYINRDLQSESGSSIADLLAFPVTYAQNFNANIAPQLTEILTDAILQK
jgi:S1-C subfamily serine protease